MERFLNSGAWIATALCLLPMLAAVLAAVTGDLEVWRSLAATVLGEYVINTALLVFWVALLTAIIGTGTAWLVTVYRFPGSRVLEVLLALPFAFPAYVLAYAYTDLLDHPGVVQTSLRAMMDWGPRDYWFPEIRSLGGGGGDAELCALPLCLFVGACGVPAAIKHHLSGGAHLGPRTVERVFPCLCPHGAARNCGGCFVVRDGNDR